MHASRSIRFFIVALAGGAVAQDLLGVAGAATDQINPQPVDVTSINAPAVNTGAAANPAPWVPGTEDAITPVPNPEEANIIDPLPQPAPETEPAPATVPAPADLPLDTNTSLPDSAPTPSSIPPSEPFTTLSSSTTTTPTPTQSPPPPGISLRPTDLPSPDSPDTNATLTTTRPAIDVGITMAPPRPTTLQTVTTAATRTEIPLWTPGGFAGDGNAEGAGKEGKGGEEGEGEGKGKEVEEKGPKQDFKPAHSWVLPLNWVYPAGGKGEGEAEGQGGL